MTSSSFATYVLCWTNIFNWSIDTRQNYATPILTLIPYTHNHQSSITYSILLISWLFIQIYTYLYNDICSILKMNIIENAEKECAVLGSLFQGIVNEIKFFINIYDNIQLLPVRQKRKMKKKLHLFNKRHHLRVRRDLSIPRSPLFHASVIFSNEVF